MNIEWRVPGDPADITLEAEMEDEDKVNRDGDDNVSTPPSARVPCSNVAMIRSQILRVIPAIRVASSLGQVTVSAG